jgi:hypothetical protein
MIRSQKCFDITSTIGMQIYYCNSSKSWVGYYYSRETECQVGSEWSASSRDEILIHRPEVNAWHHAVATA